MLEKIGLPAKPSLRGNTWVVDASHCQGCSSQFTFINRKHHCRRCGGIFCNSCTQQRMVLRGQGDSPVRICEPCKTLEEAARFEMRYGHKNRSGRGSSKLTSKYEDEILNQILGNDGKISSSAQKSNPDMVSSIQRPSSSASYSTPNDVSIQDGGGEMHKKPSAEEPNHVQNEIGLTSPEELRQQALDEKKRYKILKGEGKPEEALKAFKRGKELERQADALEISIRKNRKKVLLSGNGAEMQNKDGPKESGRKSALLSQVSKDKNDFIAELRELGWTDTNIHDEVKKPVGMSIEGEMSSLLGDISQRTDKVVGTSGIDKTQVVAHKRKALTLKREGKLAEAKEELKKAKILEKQLEEQELLGVAEDSDDELSTIIRSMDDDKQDQLIVGYEPDHGFDFNHLMGTVDDLGEDRNLEVTDEDLRDPEIAATLQSLGWADEFDNEENDVEQSVPVDRESLLSEIHSLKRGALNQKRAGNVAEAMAQLKKAKLLEKELGSLDSEVNNLTTQNSSSIQKGSVSQNIHAKKDSKLVPKNRLMIQKELLALKKKALALRREGKLDEAEEELKKGRVLEQQLEEMDNISKAKATQVTVGSIDSELLLDHPDIYGKMPIGEGEDDVTDEDLDDPTYVPLLSNLGWKEDDQFASSVLKHSKENDYHSIKIVEPSVTHATSSSSLRTSRKSKGELQRELLGLKRKALALRREGKTDEADEVLRSAKALETQMAEIEVSSQKEIQVEPNGSKDDNIEFADTNNALVSDTLKVSNKSHNHSIQITEPSVALASSNISFMTARSKGEIQRELLGLKRKALALRREGKTDEADEVLRSAKALETQMAELDMPRKETQVESDKPKADVITPLKGAAEEGDAEDVTEKDMHDSALTSMLRNLDWKGDKFEPVTAQGKLFKNISASSTYSSNPSVIPPFSSVSAAPQSFKAEAQRNHLGGELNPSDEIGFLSNAGAEQGASFIPLPPPTGNVMDLLTGDDQKGFRIPAEKPEGKVNFGFDVSCLPEAHIQVEPLSSSPENLRSKEDMKSFPKNLGRKVIVTTGDGEESINADEKPETHKTNSNERLASQNNQNPLRLEILAHKRKAVALKKEGKLPEAREELRQAKLLEKSLESEIPDNESGTHNVSSSVSNAPVQQKQPGASNLATKPLSGRDRFKLQQESLSHKRQALKLRREGRMAEAEAEFELAKNLEMQLEETASQDSNKSSVTMAGPVDDVEVEDFLDPQLLSALNAIGIEDAAIALKSPERPGPVKVSPGKGENVVQERMQLEEQIKAEKVKALNLKRSGKQAEALEALRRAKLYEKKINSLPPN